MTETATKEILCSFRCDENNSLQKLEFNSSTFSDRGFSYGEGLFETFAIFNSEVPLLRWHIQRLLSSCYRFGFGIDPACIKKIEQEIKNSPIQQGIGKLLLTGGSNSKGFIPGSPSEINIYLKLKECEVRNRAYETSGVVMQLCRHKISAQKRISGAKHISRFDYCLAARELDASQQGLLLSESNKVIETLHHNIFIVKNGVLITPPLTDVGVRGVARRIILKNLVGQLNTSVSLREFGVSELLDAEEVFISNAVRGVWPVKSLQQYSWPVGPLTQRLQKAFRQYVGDENAD